MGSSFPSGSCLLSEVHLPWEGITGHWLQQSRVAQGFSCDAWLADFIFHETWISEMILHDPGSFMIRDLSFDCWPCVGWLLANRCLTVKRQLADRFFGELIFTITLFHVILRQESFWRYDVSLGHYIRRGMNGWSSVESDLGMRLAIWSLYLAFHDLLSSITLSSVRAGLLKREPFWGPFLLILWSRMMRFWFLWSMMFYFFVCELCQRLLHKMLCREPRVEALYKWHVLKRVKLPALRVGESIQCHWEQM